MPGNSILLRCRQCRTLNKVPADRIAGRPLCGRCKAPLEPPRAPINVMSVNFDRELNDWPELVLVDFWAKWCGYCRMIEPVMNDLAARRSGKLKVLKVDVDAAPDLAHRFTVKATPTFILYKNGAQLGRIDGAPKEKTYMVQWVDSFLNR